MQEEHQLYDQAVKVAFDVFYSWTGTSVIALISMLKSEIQKQKGWD